jgi:hypothetical protein
MNGRVVGMAQGILGTLRAAEHSVDYIVDTERTKFEPEQIAEEAKKFTVKVTCD